MRFSPHIGLRLLTPEVVAKHWGGQDSQLVNAAYVCEVVVQLARDVNASLLALVSMSELSSKAERSTLPPRHKSPDPTRPTVRQGGESRGQIRSRVRKKTKLTSAIEGKVQLECLATYGRSPLHTHYVRVHGRRVNPSFHPNINKRLEDER